MGFGDPGREYYLGNDNINILTYNQNNTKLKIQLHKFDGSSYVAEYSTFQVGNEASGYILQVTTTD